MTFDAHVDLGYALVATPPSPATSGQTLTFASGAVLPGSAPFNVWVCPVNTAPTPANSECIRVTGLSGLQVTSSQRGQEGTSPRTILAGDQVIIGVTAKTLTDIESAVTANAAAIAAETSRAAAAEGGLQPLDADLTAIAALATTTFGRSLLTAANAAGLQTLAALGTAATQNSSAFDASGAASAAQAASQPLDSDLTAIAALTTTAFGRGLLALANAAALLSAAGAAAATDLTAEIARAQAAEGLLVPIANSPATVAVMAVATTNVASLSTSTPVVDGYTLLTGDYVLLTAQSTASQNGIWKVPASGAWTRPAAFPSGGVVYGLRTVAMNGAIYANSAWNLTTPAAGITVDTTSQVWALQQTPEAALALSNVTTANATTSKHGLLPILSGSITDTLMGDGSFAPPNLAARGLFASTDLLVANGTGCAPWSGAGISSGNVTGATKDKDHPGVVGLQCALNTANSGYSFLAGPIYLGGSESCEMVFDVALTANTQVFWGFHNTLTATAPTKGVWLNINGTTVEGQTGGTAVQTTGTTFTLVQGTYYHAKIVVAANGQSASFFLYDSTGTNLLWSDTCAVAANMPLSTDQTRNTIIAVNSGSIAVSSLVFLDYLNLNVPRALAR